MAYQYPCLLCAYIKQEYPYPYCLTNCKTFQEYWKINRQQFIFQARITAKDIPEAVEKIYRKYENITDLRIWLSHVQPYEEPWYEYSVTCDGKKVAE